MVTQWLLLYDHEPRYSTNETQAVLSTDCLSAGRPHTENSTKQLFQKKVSSDRLISRGFDFASPLGALTYPQ